MGQKELSHDISNIFGISYLSDVGGPDSSRVVERVAGMIWGAFSLGYGVPKDIYPTADR